MTTYQTSADVVAAIRDELLARASNLTAAGLTVRPADDAS